MEYINTFNTTAEYNAAKSGETYGRPHVSLVLDNDEIHYENYDYSMDYLTFVALESGTFTFTPQNSNVISYSTDGGETWTEGNSVSVNSGDKVLWKGTMTPATYQGIGTFSSTAEFNAQGNAMSLLFGVNYKGQTSLTGKNYTFYYLFSGLCSMLQNDHLPFLQTGYLHADIPRKPLGILSRNGSLALD